MGEKEKYTELVDEVMTDIGGKENLSFYTHCVTRLRFNVKDKKLVKVDKIESKPGVLGVQWSGEQLQIIIGQNVSDVYEQICRKYHLKMEDKVEDIDKNQKQKKKKISINSFFDAISSCITPLLPMLIGGGMVRVVILILSQLGMLSTKSGTYVTLDFVADASIYFLPVAVGYTGARKFGANPGIGILLGGILIHPTFLAMVAKGNGGSIFGLPIVANTYSSTIFPMVLTMFICGYVEKFLSERSPKALRSILEPLGTLLIMVPLMLVILAPLGSYIGTYLAAAIIWLYNFIGPLGIAVIAAFSPLLVMTGMHTALIPYTTQALASLGKEPIMGPAKYVRDINQGIACLVVAIKTKDKEIRATAISCAITAIVGGVTEPALFGINLKFKKPLYSAMIGGFFGGLYAGFQNVARYGYGPSGVLGIGVFVSSNPMNFINEIIAIIIGVVVTFIVGMIIIKEEDLK